MKAEKDIRKLIGQKVIVHYKGLLLTGKLLGLDPQFNGRDALVQLPSEKRPRKFWASKIEPLNQTK
jgi:hypothetical protein